jgi:aminoglycoside phosphotransferase
MTRTRVAAPADRAAQVWSLLAGAGTPVVDLRDQRPPGSRIVLLDDRPGARARLRAAARTAGLVVEHEYLVLPGPGRPALICEDAWAAVRWLRATVLTVPPGVTTSALAFDVALTAVRYLVPAGLLGALAPGRAVVAGPAGAAPPRGAAAEVVRPPAPAAVVVLATSRDVNAKISVLVVPPGARRPARVVKVPTTAAAEVAVEAERSVLEGLSRRTDVAALGVPRVTGTPIVDGRAAVCTTALPGVPMQTRYHRWGRTARRRAVGSDLAAAFDWLAVLQRRTAGEAVAVRLLADGLAAVERRWPGDAIARDVVERLAPAARELAARRAPACAVHGDFWAGNLLLEGDVVTGVVDWECGELSGDPTRDVARLPLSYALYLDRHTRPGHRVPGHRGLRADTWGAGLAYAVRGTGWFPTVVREYVSAALTRLGLPDELWCDVLLMGIADVAATADHPDFARSHVDLLVWLLKELPS